MYKLSPSDFGYLWNDCKHCYYQKVKYGISAPSIFPAMFNRITGLLQSSIMGQNLQSIHPDLPSGTIEVKEGFLRSKPVKGSADCFIQGRFDILTKLDDGTHTVIDFKITTPDEDKIQKYKSQLHAYKYALENPADVSTPLKISKLGVISVNPQEMEMINGKLVFTAQPTWHPITEDMDNFFMLIQDVSNLLNGPLPTASEKCPFCKYRTYFSSKTQPPYSKIPF